MVARIAGHEWDLCDSWDLWAHVSNGKLLTANGKSLTVALESIMERNLVKTIDPDTEVVDQAIF